MKNKKTKKMGMNKLVCLLLFASVFGLPMAVVAQDDLETDSFVVVKEYVPTLSQATKIRINPQIDDTFRLDMKLKYEFLDKNIPSKFTPEPIKAATLKGEPLVRLYRNYLILGYGTSNMPLAEFYYGQLRSKTSAVSVMGRHHSSSGINKIENSGFSNNALGLSGSKFTRKMTYTGDLKYTYDQVHYYGYSPDVVGLDVEEADKNEDILQLYNSVDAGIQLGNNQRDTTGLKHYTRFGLTWVEDRFGTEETNVRLGQEVSKIQDKQTYTLNWDLDYNKQADSEDSLSNDYSSENTLIHFQPGIMLNGQKWNLNAGIRLAAEFRNGTRLLVFPMLNFRFNLVKSIVIPYAEVSGDLKRNTYNAFRKDNPFVASGLNLLNTENAFKIQAGIRGNLSKNTSFNVYFAQTNVKNMPLYVKDTHAVDQEYRWFTVIYDDVNVTELGGELAYEPVKRWRVVLGGKSFVYSPTTQAFAWHKPGYKVTFLTQYHLGDKIQVELLTHLIGSQKALNVATNQAETLPGVLDLNLGFDYRYTKKIGVFLDFNNLASVRYEKWQDYPTQAFNAMLGFKFSF